MNGALRTALRIVFLAVLIWVLAALLGKAPGATLQIGSRKKKCGGWSNPGRDGFNHANRWITTGMRGQLITSPGTDVPTVGRPLSRYF